MAFIWLFATPKGMGVLHIPTLLFTLFCLSAGVFSFMWGPQLILWGLTQMFSPPDDGEEEENDDNNSVRHFEQL
jgi:predicted phage tail protein